MAMEIHKIKQTTQIDGESNIFLHEVLLHIQQDGAPIFRNT